MGLRYSQGSLLEREAGGAEPEERSWWKRRQESAGTRGQPLEAGKGKGWILSLSLRSAALPSI